MDRAQHTDNSSNSGRNKVYQFWVRGVFGFDKDGCAGDDGIDILEASSFHGFAGFYKLISVYTG